VVTFFAADCGLISLFGVPVVPATLLEPLSSTSIGITSRVHQKWGISEEGQIILGSRCR